MKNLVLLVVVVVLLGLVVGESHSNVYVTTCHSDGECGSVCSGKESSDESAPTEGFVVVVVVLVVVVVVLVLVVISFFFG